MRMNDKSTNSRRFDNISPVRVWAFPKRPKQRKAIVNASSTRRRADRLESYRRRDHACHYVRGVQLQKETFGIYTSTMGQKGYGHHVSLQRMRGSKKGSRHPTAMRIMSCLETRKVVCSGRKTLFENQYKTLHAMRGTSMVQWRMWVLETKNLFFIEAMGRC